MTDLTFNTTMPVLGGSIEQPSDDVLRNTLSLYRASPEDAMKYGGELTRAALSAMNIRNDRQYVVVDTKVHMLMKGMCPAIPGWHTDGAPRPKGAPTMELQHGDRPSRYHLLVTGRGCLTQFLHERNVTMRQLPDGHSSLYAAITKRVNNLVDVGHLTPYSAPSCQVIEWDWWELHQGVLATANEWRFLIRVAETDDTPPNKDLRDVCRIQQQVYAPLTFGW